MTPEKYFQMIRHAVFAQVDVMLRRGAHIGEEDQDKHEFIRDFENELQAFYALYGAHLHHTQEGTYYLSVEDGSLLKKLTLSHLDMIIGKTLASMLLEPDILTTLGRVSLDRLTHAMELHPGRKTLLQCTGIRVADEESANRKLRESIGKSLNLLADLNFLQWSPRQEEIVPYKSLLRFADDVRTASSIGDNLARSVADGSVVIGVPLDDVAAPNDDEGSTEQ